MRFYEDYISMTAVSLWNQKSFVRQHIIIDVKTFVHHSCDKIFYIELGFNILNFNAAFRPNPIDVFQRNTFPVMLAEFLNQPNSGLRDSNWPILFDVLTHLLKVKFFESKCDTDNTVFRVGKKHLG